MAYIFNRDRTARFKFHTTYGTGTDTTTLAGINATLQSADTICDGVSSLMAIGGNTPRFFAAVRTVTENVEEED